MSLPCKSDVINLPVRFDPDNLTIHDLRLICSAKNLPITGERQDLTSRISDFFEENQCDSSQDIDLSTSQIVSETSDFGKISSK